MGGNQDLDARAYRRSRLGRDEDLEVYAYRPLYPIEEVVIWVLGVVVFCGYLTAVVRSSAGLGKRLLCFFSSSSDLNEELKAVAEHRMIELKVWRVRLYLTLVCCVCCPWALASMVELAQGSFNRISTPASEIGWLLFQAFCGVILIKPDLLKPRNLDIVFLFVVAHVVLQETPLLCCTQDGIERASMLHLVFMMGLNLVRGLGSRRELLLVVAGNTVFIGCATYLRWSTFRKVETWGTILERAGLQGLLAALAMVFGALVEAGYWRLVTQGLQLAEAKEMHRAATALLRSCYDIVVELDSAGSVNGASQDLGSLLLRNRSMDGVHLADLIVDEEDRRQFRQRLAAPRMESLGLAESMHVTMKDALGNTLRMEMMWFACRRAEGVDHFIVGIREFADQPQVTCGSSGHSRLIPEAADSFPSIDDKSAPRSDWESSSGEDTSAWSEPEDMDIEAEQAVLVVDLADQRCPIRGVTTGFRTHVGYVSTNAPLSSVVKKTDLMVTWMQKAVNSLTNGRPPPPDCSVTVRMPQGKLKARCRLVLSATGTGVPDPEVDVDLRNIAVLFYSITHCHPRSRQGSRRGLTGTPACPALDRLSDKVAL